MNATVAHSPVYVNLMPGDPAPWFHQRSASNPDYAFDTAAGRYIVLCFYATAADSLGRQSIQNVLSNRHYFDGVRCSFFGVSLDAQDETEGRVSEIRPGIRFFWDFNGAVSRLYGAIPKDVEPDTKTIPVRRFWMVLDPTLRILRIVPFAQDGSDAAVLFDYLKKLPSPDRFAGVEIQAPIIFLPNVLEQQLCHQLIDLYRKDGGRESGFMREVGGKIVSVEDHALKRRKDYTVEDPDLILQLQYWITRRICPELLKLYSFKATRMERYIVGCYSAEDNAHFTAHRDNTAGGTAHRRFAISINLNADFEGGDLIFPEYGPRTFRPPPGGAVIFPCALLHAVSQVTSGSRYAFLAFLYDEESARMREANNKFLGEGVKAYKSNN